jgi:hypothetical protein
MLLDYSPCLQNQRLEIRLSIVIARFRFEYKKGVRAFFLLTSRSLNLFARGNSLEQREMCKRPERTPEKNVPVCVETRRDPRFLQNRPLAAADPLYTPNIQRSRGSSKSATGHQNLPAPPGLTKCWATSRLAMRPLPIVFDSWNNMLTTRRSHSLGSS